MDELKTTFKKAIQFELYANAYLKSNPKERSAFTLALEKILSRPSFKKDLAEFRYDLSEQVDKIRGEYREKDKDGNFKEKIIGEGTVNATIMPVFKPGEEDKFKRAVKDMESKRLESELSFKPHIVPIPPKLDIKYIEPLTGFVFEAMDEKELEDFYLKQAE